MSMKIINKILEGWRYLLIAPFLFLAHATSFFLHNGIPILSQEYLGAALIISALCVPLGLLMVFGGSIIRIIAAAILSSLFIVSLIDDSTLLVIVEWIRFKYAIAILVFVISVGLYFIRQHADRFLIILFGIFFVGSFFTSPSPPLYEKEVDISGKSDDVTLPPYIHIVLDEHIGIEGIPPSEDPNHAIANEIKSKYIQNGFQVYGRAYSRYTLSLYSFTSFLALEAIDHPSKYSQGNSVTQHLKQNALFEELSKKGYNINVIQSSYLDVCDGNEKYLIKHCITYNLLAPSPISSSNSLSIMFSSVLTTMRIKDVYDRLQKTRLGHIVGLHNIKNITNPSSSEATYGAFKEVLNVVGTAEKGSAYFVHLLLPHRPYKFNKECSVMSGRSALEAESNYEWYLEQVSCVQLLMDRLLSKLKENPNAINSTIVIHGDHGSRIVFPGTGSITGGVDSTSENFIQSFSAFFAVRGPEYKAGYDRRPLPLDYLLGEVVRGKKLKPNDDGIVYLNGLEEGNGKLIRTSLPPFSQGLPAKDW